MKKRYRATFLLQLLIVVATIGAVMGLVAILDGVPRMLGIVVLVACVVALELEVLETLIEWWVLRWASRHTGPVSSRWFVDLDAAEALARAESRRDVDQNPSLW